MATCFGARARLPPPKHPDQGLSFGASTAARGHTVTLRHPKYPDKSNVLLVLKALDPFQRSSSSSSSSDNDGDGGPVVVEFGLHHDTARVACAIIANSRWDGFLSEDRADGAEPVAAGPDDPLLGNNYYFHVPRRDGDGGSELDVPYPIVPSFAHFQFPHNNLPPTWTVPTLSFSPNPVDPAGRSNFDHTILTRDVSCRLTASTIGTEIAHFIPRTEATWFAENQMFLYASEPEVIVPNKINDPSNAMLLSSDLNSAYDRHRFVLAPKWGTWVVHVLTGTPGQELAAVYHNVTPQPLSGLAVEYLFTRFAWTVLAQSDFVKAGVSRRVVVQGQDGVPTTQEVSGPECRAMFAPARSKSRSESPKKRARDGTADEDNEEHDHADVDDPVWDARGRPRKRRAYSPEASRVGYWHNNASDLEVQAGYA